MALLGFNPIADAPLAAENAGGTDNATATQQLARLGQTATAQVVVSATAAQQLALLGQTATTQVVESAAATQSLAVQQTATTQVFVSAAADQSLAIAFSVCTADVDQAPGDVAEGWTGGTFSRGRWRKLREQWALEDEQRKAALTRKRAARLKVHAAKRAARVAAIQRILDQQEQEARNKLLMQSLGLATGTHAMTGALNAMQAQRDADEEEEAIMLLHSL